MTTHTTNAAATTDTDTMSQSGTDADPMPRSGTDTDPITKIGTEVFGLRVISGCIYQTDPDTIVLRQLYPSKPANIGHIDATSPHSGPDSGRVHIALDRAGEWIDHDRSALAAFFLTRYTDRYTDHFADQYSDRHIGSPSASSTSVASTSLEANDDRAA